MTNDSVKQKQTGFKTALKRWQAPPRKGSLENYQYLPRIHPWYLPNNSYLAQVSMLMNNETRNILVPRKQHLINKSFTLHSTLTGQ